MLQVLTRRVLTLFSTLLGVTVAVFIITHFVPGDPLTAILGQRAMSNPEIVATYRAKWGLDKSLPEQYFIYMWRLIQGDMGISIRTQRPVFTDLAEFLPATIELALGALTLAILGGIIMGLLAAVKVDSWIDHGVRMLALIGSSMPVFWTALIFLQIFYAELGWLPGPGRLDSTLQPPPPFTGLYLIDSLVAREWSIFWNALTHLILPSLVLGWYQLGLIARITRTSMLEVLSADYVRTAHSKGMRNLRVILRHAFPNALIPVVTIVGLAVAGLMAGAVLTETIFAWPGIGRYAVNASTTLDFPGIMGVTLLISVLYVSSSLVVDMIYILLDPRIRA